MTNKEKFIEEIENITSHFEEPCDLNEILSEEAYTFFESLKKENSSTSPITEKGINILKFMQENNTVYNNVFSAKTIGEGLFVSSRAISGTMRKLVTDGYVEKIGQNPVCYSLTEKGHSFD